MSRFEGAVVLVTGGARGQGRSHAARFAQEGADVVIADVPKDLHLAYPTATAEDLEETAGIVRSFGRRCIAAEVDVRDQAALNALVDRAVGELGSLDVLCANAGILNMGSALEMAELQWEEMISVNLTGVWKSIRAAARVMAAQRSGSIVVTTSTNSTEAFPDMTGYVAAKHGALELTRAFALELGKFGIRVNAVAPGVVATKMTDSDEIRAMIFGADGVTFEDYVRAGHNWNALADTTALPGWAISDAVAWLASDEARYITGQEVVVDGGHLVLPGFNHAPVTSRTFAAPDYRAVLRPPAVP